MPLSARTVLIPLAGFGSETGQIARVHADAGLPGRNPASLKPQIAELADWQLYEAGAIALGSVKRLNLKPKGLGLSQRLNRGAVSGHLTVTNGPDLLGLSPENGRSAELGLALALLMHAGQSRDHLVIATGRLSRDTAPSAVRDDDVSVLPVGELARKVAVLREALDAQRGSAFARKVLFLFLRRRWRARRRGPSMRTPCGRGLLFRQSQARMAGGWQGVGSQELLDKSRRGY